MNVKKAFEDFIRKEAGEGWEFFKALDKNLEEICFSSFKAGYLAAKKEVNKWLKKEGLYLKNMVVGIVK